ncbi:Hypothetical predicted protein [Paramuricea clavata]|uniref:Uncharacterized protein n=1 Tax=Paramuricea clavata TaxID=317549 RepID=A0A6S7J9V3_PARCT|nr:Hypothetical predicted protein [Paramuricea clavata]
MSSDGDQIYIDYAPGRPYMECENVTQSTCSIELNKTISFHGNNGQPIIKCKKSCKLFVIKNSKLKVTKVAFHNLVFRSAHTVAECTEASAFELVLENTTFANNSNGIHSTKSENCFININNSTFQEKTYRAIGLKCTNLTAHITNSVFKRNPISLQTFYKKSYKSHSRVLEVFVRNSVFDGEHSTVSTHLFAIKPQHALVLNISIWESAFVNHLGMTKSKNGFSSLLIREVETLRNGIYVSLRNIRVENNLNKLPAVNLMLRFSIDAPFMVEILNSTFRNNSAALVVQMSKVYHRMYASTGKIPTVTIHNNTFTRNFNGRDLENYVPAIFFKEGKYRVTSCRFYDNKAGSRFSAVVIVSKLSNVTFRECYFENHQTVSFAAQLYAKEHSFVSFKGKNIFNILALKTGETIFLRMPFYKTSRVLINHSFQILCPQGYVLNSQKTCNVYENTICCTYIYITCAKCPPKTYALKRAKFIYNTSNHIKCMQCPRGGNCISGTVKAKPNFWGYKTNTSITFAQCPPGYCCDSNDCVSYDSCHGNRTGTLCGRCSGGMSDTLFSSQCTANAKCSGSLFIPSALAMLLLYLIFFLYHEEIVSIVRKTLFGSLSIFETRKTDRNVESKRMQSSGLLKVIFYYYQVVRLLRSTVGPQNKNKIIAKPEDIIGRVLNMVLVDVSLFSCPVQNLQPVQKAAILHSVGYCLLVLLGILYLVTSVLQVFLKPVKPVRIEMRSLVINETQPRPSKFKARVASAFTYISLLMYASSTQLCLSLLHCVPVGDKEVLFLDGNIKCYQTFQYFLLAYVVSSVLPFCLVPVLGAYLLKMDRISVAQFCIACIFPLPFCCLWVYLLVRDYRFHKRTSNNTMESSRVVSGIREDDQENGSHGTCSADNCGCCQGARQHNCCLATTQESESSQTFEDNSLRANEASEQHVLKTAILRVLLGPFRPHKAFLCFGDSILPWEGYLIFRRLALILVLTFVHDNRLKMMLTLILCVAILTSHMYIKPFTRPCDNAIEALSLSTLTVLCGFTLIKNLYYGEDMSSLSDSLNLIHVFNKLENIVVVAPLVILMFIVILSVLGKLLLLIRKCLRSCRN